ncbi:hypothetical protein Trydic_g13943 [Trypoxylus dichotomus]
MISFENMAQKIESNGIDDPEDNKGEEVMESSNTDIISPEASPKAYVFASRTGNDTLAAIIAHGHTRNLNQAYS